jgi:hypothetical protein
MGVNIKPDENGNYGTLGIAGSTGNLLLVNSDGSIPVSAGSPSMSSLLTFQSGATALGNGTAYDVSGYNTIVVQNIISATATVTYEVSQDATTWVTTVGQNISSLGSLAVQSSSSSQVRINVSGSKWFRVRISVYTSGTVDVTGYASVTGNWYTPYVSAFGGTDANSATQSLQGVGAYNLLFDGTNWVRKRTATVVGDANSGQYMPATGLMGYNGTSFDRFRGTKLYKYQEFNTLSNAGTFTVWTPASTKRFRLMGISISSSAASRLLVKDGASGLIIVYYQTSGADTKVYDFGQGFLSNAANNVLEILNSSGATVDVRATAWGTEE